ncbi:MAG: tetratricopeptide repeat protein [Pseudomonadota bacterium]
MIFRLSLLMVLVAACASNPSSTSRLAFGDDSSLSGAYLQGRYAAQDYNLPKADEAFKDVARRRDDLDANRLAFSYALAAGSMDEAERQARIIVGKPIPPTDGFQPGLQADLPRITLAAAAMRDGDYDDVLNWLEADLQSPLGQSLAVLLRSAAAYEASGLEEATNILAAQAPGTFRGLVPMHVAALLEIEGDPAGAETAYRQALNAPRNEIAAIAYARFLEDTGRTEDAQRIYSRMLQDAGLYMRAGRMGMTRTGALLGQSRAFVRSAERQPKIVRDARNVFAMALEGFAWLGFEQALNTVMPGPGGELARQEELVVPLALANLARSTDDGNDIGDYLAMLIFGFYETADAAVAAADAIPRESWLYTFAQLEKATVRAQTADDASLGIDVLREAIRKDGSSNPAWGLQLHIFLAADGQYAEADRYATEAIAAAEAWNVDPLSLWRYYFARGAARVEADRFEEGTADLEKALELAPDEPIILNHLGYTYVERGANLERAFAMIESALEQEPQNGAIVDSLGWAHYQRGNYQDAVRYLEEAVGLQPDDAVITDHLGDAYYMVGRDRDARFEWRRVPELDDADDALRALAARKLDGDFSESPILSGRETAR